MDARYDVLGDAARLARDFVDGLPSRPVHARVGIDQLRSLLARPLTEDGEDPDSVIADLAHDIEAGVVASPGPRYFGFVIGGALPVAVAADWLTSVWDQNTGGYAVAPAASVAEEAAAGWVRELLGLPVSCGIGFVTGCQMAHFTCLAAARHAVLRDAGWNVEAHGLQGAPDVRVIAGEYAHVTVKVACRMLGLGAERVHLVPADEQGRMLPAALKIALADHGGPTIVCAQAGEINTGAFDPIAEIVELCRGQGAWCHVDGAFGLWAAVSPSRRRWLEGFESADSWATRRAQMAKRALRLRDRSRRGCVRPPDGDDLQRGLHPNPRRRHSLGIRLDTGILASRPRAAAVRGAALARTRRGQTDDR